MPSNQTSKHKSEQTSQQLSPPRQALDSKSEFKRLQSVANHSLPPKTSKKLSRFEGLQLVYDSVMLIIIIVDLVFMSVDVILTSTLAAHIADWWEYTHDLNHYIDNLHPTLQLYGGYITVFLIIELLMRWLLAIMSKRYLRWFFFPFIHWYEVLGCLPQLRALRLLRAIVIVRKLQQMGYRILPKRWIAAGTFYYGLILEELADRVILTATDNLRQQFAGVNTGQRLMSGVLDKNRSQIKAVLTSLLRQDLEPKLKGLAHRVNDDALSDYVANLVGASVQEALANTPELRRYLRLIPIAGGLIESELQNMGQHVGENVVLSLSERLRQPDTITPIVDILTDTLVDADFSNTELKKLINNVVNDSLNAFEQQIKTQQWQHHEYWQLKS